MGPSVSVAYADTTSCNANPCGDLHPDHRHLQFTPVASFLPLVAQTLTAKAQAVRY
jgi:hypothetical protein